MTRMSRAEPSCDGQRLFEARPRTRTDPGLGPDPARRDEIHSERHMVAIAAVQAAGVDLELFRVCMTLQIEETNVYWAAPLGRRPCVCMCATLEL